MSKKLSREVQSAYIKNVRTVFCVYCSRERSTENLYQTKPRIKCMSCHEKRAGFK